MPTNFNQLRKFGQARATVCVLKEIITAVLPSVKITLAVSVGSRDYQIWALLGRVEPEVPEVYHLTTMDITPGSTYRGQLMDIILHF